MTDKQLETRTKKVEALIVAIEDYQRDLNTAVDTRNWIRAQAVSEILVRQIVRLRSGTTFLDKPARV